ncbi:hypothetical protein [Acinetobacter sp. ANC 3791]|uniref:hypothetical protein n=1 Tax=Acinetobacter sp. ANC 3791 TaxID=2529836 RepID=UPI001039E782|nr:hypothetical protein [Acinetobacter sp. ANC 3791]TCB81301.1 hypothetical protein E0H90_15070 [Acinetobacter sp. ANC 3791]
MPYQHTQDAHASHDYQNLIQQQQLALLSPNTLAQVGIALSRSLGCSPWIGAIAGAAIGGAVLVMLDSQQAPQFSKPFSHNRT